MTDRPAVVVVAPEDLAALIRREVRAALDERSSAPASEWLNSAGAAEVLGVHPRTVSKLAAGGEIPASRIGKLWRFRRSDLEAYLANGSG